MANATNDRRASALWLLVAGLICAGCAKNSETNQGNPPPVVNVQPNEPAPGTTILHPNGTEELVIPLREVTSKDEPALREIELVAVAPRELEVLRVAPREKEVDLTNEDIGIDPALPNFKTDRLPEVAVPQAVKPTEPVGIDQPRSPPLPEIPSGFKGRTAATREALAPEGDASAEIEAAIANALVWIAKQQKPDGSWEYDGTQKSEKVAATAMAVLAFLGAGETHKDGKKYKAVVAKGIKYLQGEVKRTGQVGGGTMYTHALGALALSEAYGMTQDKALRFNAQLAITYIVKAQGNDGGWRYAPNSGSGDTSVFGWQMQALKSAQLAGLTVPKACLQNAEKFLDSMASEDGSRFGYSSKEQVNQTLSTVGLLGKLFLGTKPDNDAVKKGVKTIWDNGKPDKKGIDTYYLWYGTLLFQQVGGDAAKDWTPALHKALIESQVTEKTPNAKPADAGSWRNDFSHIGINCGRLGTTCMCALCLEVSYRHLPITGRGGKNDEAK